MKIHTLLKGTSHLRDKVTSLGFLFVFGGSVFVLGKNISSYFSTTLQVDTDTTFRRLVQANPLIVRTVSSLEEVSESIREGIKESGGLYTGIGGKYGIGGSDGSGDGSGTEGEGEKKENVTTDKILSLLGISSFSPISNVASAFSSLSSSENNFIVGEGLTWTVRSGSRARESLNLGSSDTPSFGGLKIETDQVLKKESGDVLKLLSIDSLDTTTTNTIESAMEANIDTLEGISSFGSAGSTSRTTLESVIESDIDSLPGITGIGSTTEDTLEAALDIGGDVTGTGMSSVTVGKIRGVTFGTPTATGGNLLVADGDSWESVSMSGDATINSSGVLSITSIPNNTVVLGTDTTGSYAATIADAGNGTITVTGSGTETAAITLDAVDLNCTNCLNATEIEDIYILNSGGDTATGNYTFTGNLTITGTTSLNGITYTWPSSDGSSSQFLQTNGSGTLSWQDVTVTLQAAYEGGAPIQLSASEGDLRIYNDANTEMLFLDESSGNVGIGTTGPRSILDISGTSAEIYLEDTGGGGSTWRLLSKGAGQAGAFSIYDNTDAAHRLFINTNGNVGIGTTGPSALLHVKKDNDGNPHFKVEDLNVAGNPQIYSIGPNAGFQFWKDASVSKAARTLLTSDGDFTIGTYSGSSWSERVRVLNSNGNVGIGTTGPDADLEIDGGSGSAGLHLDAGTSATLYLDRAATTNWSRIFYQTAGETDYRSGLFTSGNWAVADASNNEFLSVDTNGNVGIGTTGPGAKLEVSSGTTGLNSIFTGSGGTDTYIRVDGGTSQQVGLGVDDTAGWNSFVGTITDDDFDIRTNNAARVTVLNTGNVGIGTTAPDAALDVIGSIQSSSLLGGAVNLTADVSGNIIRDPSDERLKKNIVSIEGEEALEKVLGLRGVRFNWRKESNMGDQLELGLIAQEVEQVLPEAVSQGGAYKSVKYTNLVAVLIEAVQELYTRVEELAQEGATTLGMLKLEPQGVPECGEGNRGEIYFNNELDAFYGCTRNGWEKLNSPQSSQSAQPN
jgi:ribosomal protein S11